MAWTFEMRFPNESLWRMSAKRSNTPEDAASYVADWLLICCQNGVMVEVRLTKVDDHDSIVAPGDA